jgi:hypothetical protein
MNGDELAGIDVFILFITFIYSFMVYLVLLPVTLIIEN